MKILDRQKLEKMLEAYPGTSLKERLQSFCEEKKRERPDNPPTFSSLIDRGTGAVVHLYGENQALRDLLQDVFWHAPSGRG